MRIHTPHKCNAVSLPFSTSNCNNSITRPVLPPCILWQGVTAELMLVVPKIWSSLYMVSFVQVYSFYWACWTSMKLLVILDSSLVVIITNQCMNAEHLVEVSNVPLLGSPLVNLKPPTQPWRLCVCFRQIVFS